MDISPYCYINLIKCEKAHVQKAYVKVHILSGRRSKDGKHKATFPANIQVQIELPNVHQENSCHRCC